MFIKAITLVLITVIRQCDLFLTFPHPRDMARTPFTLASGDYYRDMLTMESSRVAGDMARKYQLELDRAARTNKEKVRLLEWARKKPKFLTRHTHIQGTLLSDEDIFDFTDSRLVKPP